MEPSRTGKRLRLQLASSSSRLEFQVIGVFNESLEALNIFEPLKQVVPSRRRTGFLSSLALSKMDLARGLSHHAMLLTPGLGKTG